MSRYETRNGDYQKNRFVGWSKSQLRTYAAKRLFESERLQQYPSAERWGRLMKEAWAHVLERLEREDMAA